MIPPHAALIPEQSIQCMWRRPLVSHMNITCIQQVQETPVNDVIDIDADNTDPVTVSEYAHEIFVNMKRREVIL